MALTKAQHRNIVDRVNGLMDTFRQFTQQKKQDDRGMMLMLLEMQRDTLLQLLDKMAQTEEDAEAEDVLDEQHRNYNNSRGI